MDKLTAIKIKYGDGTYSDEIPISVLSKNVEWDSTHTLVDVLGSINVDSTGTIQDQISQLFNEKVSNIQLNNYVASQLNTDVANWLNNNVDPVGSAVIVDSSLTIQGAAADAKVVGNLESALNADETQYISSYGRPIFVKAPRVKQTESGFVSTEGVVVTVNKNYKITTYDVPEGTKSVEVTSVYVAGGTSNYSVIAAYSADGTFIGAFNNNSASQTAREVDVLWEIPKQTAYIKVTWGNHSSSTKYNSVILHGIFHAEKRKMIFNGFTNPTMQVQYYFHVPIEALSGADSFSLNARFVFPCKVLSYAYYITTYDANYTNRTFIIYRESAGITRGITDNIVELALNPWDSSKTIRSSAAYAGAIINFNLEIPPETIVGNITSSGKDAFRLLGVHPCVSEYCFINDTPVTTNYYPAGLVTAYVSRENNDGYNPMKGGRLCCIGDSLTAVYYKQPEESWPYLIAKWNSMAFDNLGESGCPLAFDQSWHDSGHLCMAEKIAGLVSDKLYTHIFVMGGANDYNDSITIGQNTDTKYTTFKGAINYMIDALTNKFPCAKIVFATTYQRTANRADKPYADAMLEVCKLKGIPCLNNYENSGVQMNSSAWMAKFGANGTTSNKHLNAAGDLFVAPKFEHALKYGIT